MNSSKIMAQFKSYQFLIICDSMSFCEVRLQSDKNEKVISFNFFLNSDYFGQKMEGQVVSEGHLRKAKNTNNLEWDQPKRLWELLE